MEHQVAESVRIEEEMVKTGECLNGKNEWAESKIPNLLVQKPKGTSGGPKGKETLALRGPKLKRTLGRAAQ